VVVSLLYLLFRRALAVAALRFRRVRRGVYQAAKSVSARRAPLL
jgi:hypothetical protein